MKDMHHRLAILMQPYISDDDVDLTDDQFIQVVFDRYQEDKDAKQPAKE